MPVLAVHRRDNHVGPDVDLGVIARGTPGMGGAGLARLVNEAALTRCGGAATSASWARPQPPWR